MNLSFCVSFFATSLLVVSNYILFISVLQFKHRNVACKTQLVSCHYYKHETVLSNKAISFRVANSMTTPQQQLHITQYMSMEDERFMAPQETIEISMAYNII